jgi:hypothetical protein
MARIAGLSAGWFADPAGRFRFRYWDGNGWTDQVLDGTSREEARDVLEPGLAGLPPRAALPVLPGSGAGDRVSAGAAVVAPPPATDGGSRASRRAIPRPSRLLIAVVVCSGLVAGGAVLVSKLADDATSPNSSASQVLGGPSTPQITGVVAARPALDGGVTFTSDAAPNGYHRTNVEGLSVALPTEWFAMAPTSQAFQSVLAQLNLPPDSPLVKETRLYVEDPLDPSVKLTIAEVPLDASVLEQPDTLAASVKALPNIVAGSVKVSTLRIDGRTALRLDDAIVQQAPNGIKVTVYTQEYLVANAKGRLMQVTFSTGTDRAGDSKLATIAESIHRVH